MPIYAIETRAVNGNGDGASPSRQHITYLLANKYPEAKWMAFARLGASDYIDIFEAPDETVAKQAAILIRSNGCEIPEASVKIPWYRCLRQTKVEVLS